MKSKKIRLLLLSAALLLPSCSKTEIIKKSFTYSQGKENDYSNSFYYSDDYFLKDSTVYNPSLATCSLSFAMSSFASNRNGSINDYSRRYRNAEDFLSKCGFDSFYVNSYYREKPQSDSLGVAIASKKIQDYTLLAIGIRGGNYEQEWASNFTLGDGKETLRAKGFFDASTIYLNSLKEYLENYGISGKIKIWSVGYSRGGASNNLACGRIDKMIKEDSFFYKDVALKKEDLFCYCFEPPKGASFKEEISPKDEMYDNIHNIVNYNDPVPKVAMKLLGFTRYGVDHYLLDKTRHLSFNADIGKIKDIYQTMQNYSSLGEYVIDRFSLKSSMKEDDAKSCNFTSGMFLEELIDDLVLYGVDSLDTYVDKYQTGLRTLCKTLYRIGNPKSSFIAIGLSLAQSILLNTSVDYLLNALFYDTSAFVKKILVLLQNVLQDYGIQIDYTELFSCVSNLALTLSKILSDNISFLFSLLTTDNLKALASAHYPEICLSNLMAMDKNYTSAPLEYDMSGKCFLLKLEDVKEDAKMNIKQDGNTVFSYENSSFSSDTIPAKINKENEMYIYLPDEEYEVNSSSPMKLYRFDAKKEDYVFLSQENNRFSIKKL